MESGKKAALALLGIILASALIYVLWTVYSYGRPGAFLEGKVTITHKDGTEIVVGSEDRQLFQLLNYWNKQHSVITYQNQKLWSIKTDINLRFAVDPPDKSLQAQYWVLYWVEMQGTFFSGARGYSSIIGFTDLPVSTYSATKSMNKWQGKVGNPSLSWFYIGSFVEPFYREATSSVWVDLSTYITDPKTVTDTLSGVPIVGSLADQLSAHLSSATVKNGDKPLVIQWSMTGPDYYVRLKRSNWNGLSVHLGDFSIGLGEFARMWNEDVYRVSFKVGYFFRWKDVTGEFSSWRYGTVNIATFDMKVQAGEFYVLSADVSGSVQLG